MSEHEDHVADDPAVGASEDSTAEVADAVTDEPGTGDDWDAPSTGVVAVDEVLASVQSLEDRPVEEHVAVFEQAHERLRRALDPGHG